MGNLGNILKKHAKRLGIERQVEAVGVVEEATKVISKYIPKEDFEVISFKDGVLKIKTESSAAANEIQLRKGDVIRDVGSVKLVRITFI